MLLSPVGRSLVMLGLTLAVVVGATVWVRTPVQFPMDDAYITIANAELILNGGVDNYGLERPTGATSPLHLLALTALGAAFPLPSASLVISLAAAVALALGLWAFARRMNASPVTSTLVATAGLLSGEAWFQITNGLETGLAMAAAIWVLLLVTGPRSPASDFGLAMLLGILPFVRPELAVLSAFSALELTRQLRRERAHIVRLAVTALVSFSCMATIVALLTGNILPETAGAKEAFFAESTLPLERRLDMLPYLVSNPISPLLAGMLFLPLVRGGWTSFAFAVVFVYAACNSLPGAIVHNNFRYLYPFLPLGIAGWLVLAQHMKVRRLADAAIICGAAFNIALFPLHGWSDWRNALHLTQDQEQLVAWAEANLPEDARILVHDAGYFAWSTDFRLVDLVGLKTPSSILAHREHTLPTAGARRYVAVDEIAREQGSTHAIILDLPFWGDLVGDLRRAGWDLSLLRSGFYKVYVLTPPETRLRQPSGTASSNGPTRS